MSNVQANTYEVSGIPYDDTGILNGSGWDDAEGLQNSDEAAWCPDDSAALFLDDSIDSDAGDLFGDIGKAVGNAAHTVAHSVSDVVNSKPFQFVKGIGGDLVNPLHGLAQIGTLIPGISKAAGDFDKWTDPANWVKNIAHAIPGVKDFAGQLDQIGQTVDASQIINATANSIAQGKPLTQALLDGAREGLAIAKQVGGAMAAMPGFGTGSSQAMQAAEQLLGGPAITDTVMQAAQQAMPGGQIAQAAFQTGLQTVQNAAQNGGNLSAAFLDAARNNLPGGQAAKVAFDAAVALAHGKNLQDVAASTVAQQLMQQPALQNLPIAQLAQKLGVPQSAAQKAIGSLTNAAATIGQGQRPAPPSAPTGRGNRPAPPPPPAPRNAGAFDNARMGRPPPPELRRPPAPTGRGAPPPPPPRLRTPLVPLPHLRMPGDVQMRNIGNRSMNQALAQWGSHAALPHQGPHARDRRFRRHDDAQLYGTQAQIAGDEQADEQQGYDPQYHPLHQHQRHHWHKTHLRQMPEFGNLSSYQRALVLRDAHGYDDAGADDLTGEAAAAAAGSAAPEQPGTGTGTRQAAAGETKAQHVGAKVLKIGSKGADVVTWQHELNGLGYKGKDGKALTEDGDFGANSDFATKKFQTDKGLKADGKVGPKSLQAMHDALQGAPAPTPLPASPAPATPAPPATAPTANIPAVVPVPHVWTSSEIAQAQTILATWCGRGLGKSYGQPTGTFTTQHVNGNWDERSKKICAAFQSYADANLNTTIRAQNPRIGELDQNTWNALQVWTAQSVAPSPTPAPAPVPAPSVVIPPPTPQPTTPSAPAVAPATPDATPVTPASTLPALPAPAAPAPAAEKPKTEKGKKKAAGGGGAALAIGLGLGALTLLGGA